MIKYNSSAFDTPVSDLPEPGSLEINGSGKIDIRNTGGSSASEGGMGTGNSEDKEKGELSNPSGEKGAEESDEDFTFDPIKKNVREGEKEGSKD